MVNFFTEAGSTSSPAQNRIAFIRGSSEPLNEKLKIHNNSPLSVRRFIFCVSQPRTARTVGTLNRKTRELINSRHRCVSEDVSISNMKVISSPGVWLPRWKAPLKFRRQAQFQSAQFPLRVVHRPLLRPDQPEIFLPKM